MQEFIKKIYDFVSPELLSTIITLLAGLIATKSFLKFSILRLRKKRKISKSYSEQLTELTSNLTKSSAEVDKILIELSSVTKSRQDSLTKLEADLSILEKRETDTKKRIEELQNIPIAVADYFVDMTKEGEKKSAKRDYLLFGAGVIVSAIVAIILKLLGWG